MRFDSILGQNKPLGLIDTYIQKGVFCGGFIFSGPEGIGKLMAAKAIAQKLNCTGSNQPCGVCEACVKIERLNHPDLHIIQNGEAQIKIDDIRAILREASFLPYEALMKVFIIDNAHKLNLEAANSLLKILEEPPKRVSIILITHKPQSIIKTISSRCKTIRFAPLVRSSLENALIKNYLLDKASAHFIAYYAEGRMGLALRLKDSLPLVDKNKIFDAFVLSQNSLDRALVAQNKEQLRLSLNILASWFRDLYLLKAGLEEDQAIHLDRKNDLLKLAPRFTFKQLDEMLSGISESMLYLEKNINNKLLLHNLGAQLWKG